MTPIEQVRAKIAQVIETAKVRFGVDLSTVPVSFNKGRAAGWASWQMDRRTGITHYKVKFNVDMIMRGDPEVLRNMVEDTVPHEYAHILCFMRPELGKNHNEGWRSVCIALGGTGKRTHDNEVVVGRGTTYEYTTTTGEKVRISERKHAQVQRGVPITYIKKSLGSVNQYCAYSIVGMNGRTLPQPIVKKAVNDPQAIEHAQRMQDPVEFIKHLIERPVTVTVTDLTRKHAKVQKVRLPGLILPPAGPANAPATLPQAGESKAAVSRRIMLSGFQGGKGYETIIQEMIAANGYARQLARATFAANAPKVGIPESFYK